MTALYLGGFMLKSGARSQVSRLRVIIVFISHPRQICLGSNLK
jgi:hypothetical protein